MDFNAHPGLLFVVATLLPLASFVLLLFTFGLKTLFRNSPEGSLGASLYQTLGGAVPQKWPAFVATGAIGLAFVFSLIGTISYFGDHHEETEIQKKIRELEGPYFKLVDKQEHGEALTPDEEKQLKALESDLGDQKSKLTGLHHRWNGHIDWLRLEPAIKDRNRGTALQLGFKIDSLAALMFVMVTFVATLIHVFSIGYMADEQNRLVEDHQVHGEDGGHLKRRGRFGRFFMYLSLFCFSMLNLVLADNLFQVFLSWELVGICSFLLIGFYFERHSASSAANKAFITNRVGDAGFIIGLLIFWTHVGTFNFDDLFRRLRAPIHDSHGTVYPMAGKFCRGEFKEDKPDKYGRRTVLLQENGSQVIVWWRVQPGHTHAPTDKEEFVYDDPGEKQNGSMPYWILVVGGLGIFLGCVGKSAQFPLHVWLPDAMEGPTPVSALIHAATMVAAGVYLVGRCFPLFTSEALLVIAYTGAITLFVAATIAIVMTDIKKVLAYSTVSQLGFMMLALGVGGWVAGLFHLITHAVFKALLFLGSGSVIHGCHHEQEMTRMGGLYTKMKITALTMLMGVLAISGIPGFSGWYSKDAILASALGFAIVHPEHALLFLLPLLTAGITTFYMFRMWFLTFTGEPRDHHLYEHAHESPRVMTTPLIVLAVLSVCVAWGYNRHFFSPVFPFINAEASTLEHALHHSQPQSLLADFGSLGGAHGEFFAGAAVEPRHSPRAWAAAYHHTAGNVTLIMVALGFSFAYATYYRRQLDPEEASAQFPGVYRFLRFKWYFDELYSAILVRPAMVIAYWCKAIDTRGIDRLIDSTATATVALARSDGRFDNRVIDGLVNLVASVLGRVGGSLRRVQTGYLRSYVLFLVLAAVGVFVLLSYFVALATAG